MMDIGALRMAQQDGGAPTTVAAGGSAMPTCVWSPTALAGATPRRV